MRQHLSLVRLPAAGAFRVAGVEPALTVSVIPLKPSHPLAAFRQMHLALVVLASAGQQLGVVGVGGPVLQALWGLTPTEARLALALTTGQSLHVFAQAEGCRWHTVRTHLRNTLRKSGYRRQLEQVQAVQALQVGLH